MWTVAAAGAASDVALSTTVCCSVIAFNNEHKLNSAWRGRTWRYREELPRRRPPEAVSGSCHLSCTHCPVQRRVLSRTEGQREKWRRCVVVVGVERELSLVLQAPGRASSIQLPQFFPTNFYSLTSERDLTSSGLQRDFRMPDDGGDHQLLLKP